jgi:hypothetical protein
MLDIGYTTDPSVYRPIVEGLGNPVKENSLAFILERQITNEYRQAKQNIMNEYKDRSEVVDAERTFDMQSLYEDYGLTGLPGNPTLEYSASNQRIITNHLRAIQAELDQIKDSTQIAQSAVRTWRDERLVSIALIRNERLASEVQPFITESIQGLQPGDYVKAVFYKDDSRENKRTFEGALRCSQAGTLYLPAEVVVLNGRAHELLALPIRLIDVGGFDGRNAELISLSKIPNWMK